MASKEYNRRYYIEHRAEALKYAKDAYQADPDKFRARNKEKWQKNKVKYKPAMAAWAVANRDKMLAYYRQKQVDFIAFINILKNKPCGRCLNTYPPHVMEFDHVRGTKKYTVSKMTNYRRELILEEVAKCDLLCCVCHRLRTHDARPEPKTQKLIAFQGWINQLKDNPCTDCGRTYPHVAMDFDHVRGVKISGITNMWSWGRDRVLAELAKCELVCANCHRERTHARVEKLVQYEEALRIAQVAIAERHTVPAPVVWQGV